MFHIVPVDFSVNIPFSTQNYIGSFDRDDSGARGNINRDMRQLHNPKIDIQSTVNINRGESTYFDSPYPRHAFSHLQSGVWFQCGTHMESKTK